MGRASKIAVHRFPYKIRYRARVFFTHLSDVKITKRDTASRTSAGTSVRDRRMGSSRKRRLLSRTHHPSISLPIFSLRKQEGRRVCRLIVYRAMFRLSMREITHRCFGTEWPEKSSLVTVFFSYIKI